MTNKMNNNENTKKIDCNKIFSRRSYSPEFKEQLVLSILKHSVSMGEASKKYGISRTSLRRWVKQYGNVLFEDIKKEEEWEHGWIKLIARFKRQEFFLPQDKKKWPLFPREQNEKLKCRIAELEKAQTEPKNMASEFHKVKEQLVTAQQNAKFFKEKSEKLTRENKDIKKKIEYYEEQIPNVEWLYNYAKSEGKQIDAYKDKEKQYNCKINELNDKIQSLTRQLQDVTQKETERKGKILNMFTRMSQELDVN